MTTRRYGQHAVELSNLDKVFFPDANLTKGDLIGYYERIASFMLPHMKGRPVSMERFPDGIEGESFFQKEASDYFPEWITLASMPKKGGTVHHVVCDNEATLVYLANQGCITPHVALSRTDKRDHPDLLIFDIDPPDADAVEELQFAARVLRDALDEYALPTYVKSTGSKGLHVCVPLDRNADFDTVRAFAQNVAKQLAHDNPDRLTVEQRKDKRGTRVFLDTGRNAYGQTAVAPYAVRARPGAPVAIPLAWDEALASDFHPQKYTITNVFRRLGQIASDPWQDIYRRGHRIAPTVS